MHVFVCLFVCFARSLPEQRKRSESAEEMVGMEHFDYPHPMPLPTMYDHGKSTHTQCLYLLCMTTVRLPTPNAFTYHV